MEVKLLHGGNVVFTILASHIVDFYIDPILFVPNINLTVMKRSIGHIKIHFFEAEISLVKFCLLGNDLFNQPTHRPCVSFHAIRQYFPIGYLK